jgi:hypothetical protein
MAIDKLIPRSLNKEDDVRLVAATEMTDALNVRLSADADGDGGVIKNAYGNAAIAFKSGDGLPAGTNEVIGSLANTQEGEIYFFVWNSNNNHSVYRFSSSSNESQLIYRDSVLGFVRYATIRASAVKNISDETLLYFTEGITPPKKINVTRALLGLYPAAFTTGTAAEKLSCLTVIKQPPMTAPTFVFSTNVTLLQNNLYKSTFQFAAQYIYQDGERSAISPYSELAVSASQFFDGIISEEEKLKDNTLTISVPNSVADVKEIIVIARNGNIGAFYEIATVLNNSNSSTQSVVFDNTKLYTPISQDEVNKIYDNVPQTAESLTIVGNRLVMGAYTDGYPNIRTDVDVIPNYFPQPLSIDIGVTYPSPTKTRPPGTLFPLEYFKRKSFDIDITSIPNVTTEDSFLNITFSLDLGRITLLMGNTYTQWVQTDKSTQEDHDYAGLVLSATISSTGIIEKSLKVSASPFSISESILVPSGTVKADIVNMIRDAIVGNYNLVLDSDVTDFDYVTQITQVDDLQGTTNSNKWMFFSGSAQLNVEDDTGTDTTLLRFYMSIASAGVSAKVGYNFNVSSILNSALAFVPPLAIIKSLFTRGKSLGERYPATNALFNQITFVDTPSVIYPGDDNFSPSWTSINEQANEFVPKYDGSTTPFSFLCGSAFLSKEEDDENAVLFDSSVITTGDINGYQAFKAGATHSFGIVYYDQFNRNGGVQTVSDMYVKWFDNRASENDLYGRANSVFRVKHNAPPWAVKWAPVYAPINTIVNKFQYSITAAFTATNLQAKPFAGVSSFEEVTYLSLRSLEGKSDSYRESFSADIDYSFQRGDRVRIVQYGQLERSSINLEVLGYFDFIDDIDTNPILDLTSDEDTFNTTGKFIAVRSSEETEWDNYSIIIGEDNWRNQCIIEVYRQNLPASEQFFYEIGENFPVVNGIHQGQRTTVSPFSVDVVADGDGLIFYSDIIVYPGDVLTASGNTLIVGNVYAQVNGIYNYVFYARIISGSFSVGSYTLNLSNSSDAVIQFSQGDSYYRPRLLKMGAKAYSNNFELSFIEDYSVSDFFSSKSTSIGRVHAVIPEAKTTYHQASVVYSEPYLIGNSRLGLSSFNPSLANFKDFDYRFGAIKQLIGDDDRMYLLQERKAGYVVIGRNVIESSDGGQAITISRNVFSVPNYYLGDYGINNNPESFGFDRGRVYFADVRSGKIVRISRDGITLISEVKMDSFFKENFRYITTLTSRQKVIGGVDNESDEYIISADLITSADVSVTNGVLTYSYGVQTNAAGNRVIADVEFDDDDLFTFSTEIRNFEDICDEFEDSLNCIVFLDKLVDGQPAYVGEEFIGQTGLIYGVATNSTYDFFVTILFDLAQGNFSFTNDCAGYSGTIGSPTSVVNDFTAAYDINGGVWNTLYSYRPEAIASVDDALYTFKSGVMYLHSDAANRATYYGSAFGAVVEVISSQNNSMVKAYEALSIEGDSSWAAALSNTDQSTTILASDFEERERYYYAYIPRDSSANTGTSTITSLSGSSEVFVLGAVAIGGVSGFTITFTTPVGDIPFPIGATLYKVVGATLVALNVTVTAISGNKQITASAAIDGVWNTNSQIWNTNTNIWDIANVSDGDTIVALGNGAIEGDQMRDYYLKIRLSNNETSETEMYAVNAIFSKSNLHNELGQQ